MQSPVESIELNLSNYGPDEVSQLNEWSIWAFGQIEGTDAAVAAERKRGVDIIKSLYRKRRADDWYEYAEAINDVLDDAEREITNGPDA